MFPCVRCSQYMPVHINSYNSEGETKPKSTESSLEKVSMIGSGDRSWHGSRSRFRGMGQKNGDVANSVALGLSAGDKLDGQRAHDKSPGGLTLGVRGRV